MNALERTLIEKAGYDNGFENVLGDAPADAVRMASARHRAQVEVRLERDTYHLRILATLAGFADELARSFPAARQADGRFIVQGEAALAALLRRAAALALALPHQALHTYEAAMDAALAALPAAARGTEVERLVRQRVGQQTYRDALLDYWGGACAVTGIALPDVLRASHAKPWADCASDAERLDVFNGFLLVANLDALFDRFLISFDVTGRLLVSPTISPSQRDALSLRTPLYLRWLAVEHARYLAYHRERMVT
ncbi:MAG: HNH endonuclease [Metallibacterium scheffleri]